MQNDNVVTMMAQAQFRISKTCGLWHSQQPLESHVPWANQAEGSKCHCTPPLQDGMGFKIIHAVAGMVRGRVHWFLGVEKSNGMCLYAMRQWFIRGFRFGSSQPPNLRIAFVVLSCYCNEVLPFQRRLVAPIG